MMASSTVWAFFLLRTGYRKPLFIGFIGVSILIALTAQGIHEPDILGVHVSNFWYVLVVVLGLGFVFGASNPSVNNAGLDLAPDRIASITGLRAMAQQLGSLIGISVAVMIASRADSVAGGLEIAFTIFAILLACSTVLILRVPEIGSKPMSRADIEVLPIAQPVPAERA